MKNKSKGSGERKKGFYPAVAAGVGAVLVLALVISFTDLTINPAQELDFAADVYEEEALHVGADQTLPYLAQSDMDQAIFRPRTSPQPSPVVTPPAASARPTTPPPPSTPEQPISEAPAEPPSEESSPEPAPVTNAEAEAAAPPPAEESAPPAPEPSRESAQATFEPFTSDDELLWPVYGEIAMVFSQDRLIYNQTLDQWRTNDDLRISAQEGTPVRAAAAGKVVEVGNDREYGNFVRIDNGNNWETIFSQLMDNILVVEGDVVQAGQVIGGVGRPSVFSVLDGHHLSLRVLYNDDLVDPKLLLGAAQ